MFFITLVMFYICFYNKKLNKYDFESILIDIFRFNLRYN
jgi:hypothetical protein